MSRRIFPTFFDEGLKLFVSDRFVAMARESNGGMEPMSMPKTVAGNGGEIAIAASFPFEAFALQNAFHQMKKKIFS